MTDSNQRFKASGWRIRPKEARAILFIVDITIACLALALALYIWGIEDQWLEFSFIFLQERVQPWFYLLPLIWPIILVELYDYQKASNWRATLLGIATATITGAIIYALIYLISPPTSLPRVGVGVFLITAAILTLIWRILFIRIFTGQIFLRRILIIGAGETGANLVNAIEDLQPQPFNVVGFIDDDRSKIGTLCCGFPVIADCSNLLEVVEEEKISDIIVAISGDMLGNTFQTLLDIQEQGIEVTPMPNFYEEILGRVPIHHLESDWIIRSFVVEARKNQFYEMGKRIFDIIGGVIGLIILTILFPLISLIIWLDSGNPILYSQIRIGKRAKQYRILKFRTMHQDAEADGKARVTLREDARITRTGAILRRTHIDELPQFWNVLLGEMSLVGPRAERPELIIEYEKQIPFYRARLLVKPGITGLAQISYSYFATVEETSMKLEYDLFYIKHRNLMMDIVILLRTFGQVIGFRGR